MKFHIFSRSPKSDENDQRPEELLRPKPDKDKCYSRQITIEEEPDSLESIISDPSALPITVVRSRPASLYRCSTHGRNFSRQSSCSMNLVGGQVVNGSDSPMQQDEQALLNGHWRHTGMNGPPSIASPGLYYEPLKASDGSLVKRSRNLRPGSMRRYRKRAILKNGDCNVLQSRLTGRRMRFLQDVFTTLVDSQWRWTLLIFALSFFLSWLGFAVIWWLIAITHGDLEDMHMPANQADNGWIPCVLNIQTFTSCFLFSIETQHTIGYGVRTTTEECPEAIFMMCFQSIFGMMVQAFMVGIVFAKMTRSKQRTQTLLFSQKAVVCQRDGDLFFMFRVGDMRKSHIIGANIRAQLIRTRNTKEGEVLTTHHSEMELGMDECGSDLFFIWPMTVMHKIDENSPLYNISATDMFYDKFEIVVILEGTVESTGQTTQARSSYLNSEIKWGHRFDPVVSYNKDRQAYDINYSKFDETTAVDTPLCSARELQGFKTNLGTPEETTFGVRQQSFAPSEA